jgi:predicted HAD superfamily hydrolase
VKVHSFDVYDTLLTRRVAKPEDLFVELEQRLQLEAGPGRLESFLQLRRQAEADARQSAPAREVQLSEIYAGLGHRMGWNATEINRALALELQLERELSVVVPGLRARVQAARAAGFQIFFLSDMYLPGPFIRELLQREGLWEAGDELFVSGELRQAKHDGQMFQMLRAKYPEISEWHHTGDNRRADVEVPKRFGIEAHWETRCQLTHRELLARGAAAGGDWRSRLAAAMKLARLAGADLSAERRTIWDCGANVVGPIWFGFVEWCLAEAQRRGIKRLYFVARDGQIFHKVAQEIVRARSVPVECRYLYGSRQAWHLPGLEQLDETARRWIFNRQRYLTPEQVLRRVGLEPAEYAVELAEVGITAAEWTKDMTGEKERALRDWLWTLQRRETILKQAKEARESTLRYLDQEGVFDGTLYAMVDIGWRGNMQRSFSSFLNLAQKREGMRLTGFYFGLQQRPRDTVEDQFLSYWPETGLAGEQLQRLNVTILEMMAAADHGTVLGFQASGNLMIPVLDGKRNDAALAWGLDTLHAGVVEFTRVWLQSDTLSPAQRNAFWELSRSLVLEFIAAPSRLEAETWARFPHSGEQIERHKESIAPALAVGEALRFVMRPQQRPAGWWVEGSLAQRPNLVLALYLAAKRAKTWWQTRGK